MTDPIRSCWLCRFRSGHAKRCCECIDARDNHPLFEAGEPVTLQSTARAVVDKWRAWDTAPKTDGFEWHQLEAELIALEAELARKAYD